MFKKSAFSLALAFFYLSGTSLLAAGSGGILELDNQTKSSIHIGVGTVKKPPKNPDIELKAKEKYGAKTQHKVDPNDAPQIIVKMASGESITYVIEEKPLKAGKNAKLKLTTSFIGNKTSLVSQFATNNISDKDIKIVSTLDKSGKKVEAKEEKKEEAASDEGDESTTAKTTKKDDKKTPAKAKADEEEDESADESATSKLKDKDGDDEEKTAKKEKPKPTVTPTQILDLTASLKGEKREAKILGMSFSSTITTATTEPDSGMPARLQDDEWKKIKKAQTEITTAYTAKKGVWNADKVTTSAKAILVRHKVTDTDDQKELSGEVRELIDTTYQGIKARFAYPEGEKPADDADEDKPSKKKSNDDDSTSDDE